MKNSETTCFTILATIVCTISGLEDSNIQVVQLAAMINKNFEELGV